MQREQRRRHRSGEQVIPRNLGSNVVVKNTKHDIPSTGTITGKFRGTRRRKPHRLLIGANSGFDEMSKLYSVFLLIASLFAMEGLGMSILVAITEIEELIAPPSNPYGINR